MMVLARRVCKLLSHGGGPGPGPGPGVRVAVSGWLSDVEMSP